MKIPAILLACTAIAIAMPATAAPVAAADTATIQGLIQRTWARYGTTGVPRGPRFDPPRTPVFAKAAKAFLGPDPEGLSEPPDNLYCMCFDEYRPHLTRITRLDAVAANVVEARIVVSAGGFPTPLIWRLVRAPQGWLLDDIWPEGGPISVQRRDIRNGRRL